MKTKRKENGMEKGSDFPFLGIFRTSNLREKAQFSGCFFLFFFFFLSFLFVL